MLTYCLRQILSHEWFCTLIGATPVLAGEVNGFNTPRPPCPIFSPNESRNENRDLYKATLMTGLPWALFTENTWCPAAVLPSVYIRLVGKLRQKSGATATQTERCNLCNKCVYSFRGCAPENVPLKWCCWAEGSAIGFWTPQGQRAIPHVHWTMVCSQSLTGVFVMACWITATHSIIGTFIINAFLHVYILIYMSQATHVNITHAHIQYMHVRIYACTYACTTCKHAPHKCTNHGHILCPPTHTFKQHTPHKPAPCTFNTYHTPHTHTHTHTHMHVQTHAQTHNITIKANGHLETCNILLWNPCKLHCCNKHFPCGRFGAIVFRPSDQPFLHSHSYRWHKIK